MKAASTRDAHAPTSPRSPLEKLHQPQSLLRRDAPGGAHGLYAVLELARPALHGDFGGHLRELVHGIVGQPCHRVCAVGGLFAPKFRGAPLEHGGVGSAPLVRLNLAVDRLRRQRGLLQLQEPQLQVRDDRAGGALVNLSLLAESVSRIFALRKHFMRCGGSSLS